MRIECGSKLKTIIVDFFMPKLPHFVKQYKAKVWNADHGQVNMDD